MRSLIITRKAQTDILTTMDWLQSRYRHDVAAKWHRAILGAADDLGQYPDQHPVPDSIDVPGLALRERLVRRYRGVVYQILYSFDDETVTIHRIRNASRDALTADDF